MPYGNRFREPAPFFENLAHKVDVKEEISYRPLPDAKGMVKWGAKVQHKPFDDTAPERVLLNAVYVVIVSKGDDVLYLHLAPLN